MVNYLYDGTFEGLLTVIFEIYERKAAPAQIVHATAELPGLFTQTILVVTNEVKADRVWQGLGKKISATAQTHLYKAFLSEQPQIGMLIYQYAQLAFASTISIEDNFAADCVRELAHLNKQVFRESHRMEAFIRFQKTADDLYYATVAPDFNVLPIISKHFEKRYADQRWLIYDTKRHYGLYYDLEKVSQVNLEKEVTDRSGNLPADILAQQELLYQELWQTYYRHATIPERKNRKLHLRHIPLRYWKYLTEKQPSR
ncbi:TIGR03915 family putative DNA repair protein [Adhaeribacter rhizoryzae]|uniref:DNA metabolism protein n=1 Tax=Adhaeribacter rhizoryzae TaxID=2607907 RepID=A0A5M6DLG3_9BACT|nr:TIGR03915 family putative DNA repair protein [Adhaeribacter rhizoryzae]KAA5548387.1 DNA metabolism protein [Adhaeribacter rhizoryzae]